MARYQISVNVTRINPTATAEAPDNTVLPALTQAELFGILADRVELARRDRTTSRFSSGRVGFYGSAKVDLPD